MALAKPYLPQDIVEDILLRLPFKSLLRFTMVSKPWGSLISLRTQNQNLLIPTLDRGFMLFRDCGTSLGDEAALVSLDFPLKEPHQRVEILGSCNGLVAVFSFVNVSTKNLFIWNPSAGDYKKLPEPCPSVHITYRYIYGFGYDSISDDYKLFFGSKLGPNIPINTAVFSLRKNSWRMNENPHDDHNYYFKPPGVFVNGALHWLIKGNKSFGRTEISAFDLNRDKFNVLSVPHDCIKLIALGIVKDKLGIIFSDSGLLATEFWVMEDYGNYGSWTKFLRINTNLFGRYGFLEAFYISESHVLYRDENCSNLLKRYDAQEENVKEFLIAAGYEAIAYRESLLSPNFYCNHGADERHCDYRIREMEVTSSKMKRRRKHVLLS
ncbi:hypothetical protein PTKIN_Ptkin09bG0033000 [Pterospermum kingtungense]